MRRTMLVTARASSALRARPNTPRSRYDGRLVEPTRVVAQQAQPCHKGYFILGPTRFESPLANILVKWTHPHHRQIVIC